MYMYISESRPGVRLEALQGRHHVAGRLAPRGARGAAYTMLILILILILMQILMPIRILILIL